MVQRVLAHIAYGLHSGIPVCCVLDFAYRDVYGIAEDDYQISVNHIGYAPCSMCAQRILANEILPATVHVCTEACNAVMGKYGLRMEDNCDWYGSTQKVCHWEGVI